MTIKKIHLKDKKEKTPLRGHPWIFSGAIQDRDAGIDDGDIVSVCDSRGNRLGCGYFNSKTRIAVRMLCFGSQEFTPDYLRMLIRTAVGKRTGSPLLRNTDSYRIIFSEGDHIPGLIVDSYAGHLVMQCLTLGIDRLRETIVNILNDEIKPASIYERSDHEGRSLEGLDPVLAQRYGTTPHDLVMHEDDMKYYVNLLQGQKTGFYLDQRDNRALVRKAAEGRDVLNLFCYSGGFSVAAALGGARRILSVDSSGPALDLAKKNMDLNRVNTPTDFLQADIFQFLRDETITGDFIILDPPALAKTRASVHNACRGYKDLHLQVASKCPAGTVILTCSCSRFIDMRLFQMVIFGAFTDAGRKASIIGKYAQPCDHPTNIFCPETEYLKALLLHVE
ncbi:MAG: hypothetical protein A2176_05585 [Spirochaetes bacterium RBG_13_51_14]|nr:MAG: hypothetical protein A2176_05585 [Spirochaetes bacterium RBG_13_51_14]